MENVHRVGGKMKLDFSEAIKQIKDIEKRFNKSQSPTERYALICAFNHLVSEQLPFKDDHWLYNETRKAMLREQGINVI